MSKNFLFGNLVFPVVLLVGMMLQGGGAMTQPPAQSKEDHDLGKGEVVNRVILGVIENYYDPDPDDNTYEAAIVYLIRENGELRVEHDIYTCGLFELSSWKGVIGNAGFKLVDEPSFCKARDIPVFVCVKPK